MPFSVNYPRKIETPVGRFRRLTKPYSDAVEKNVWRIERKFCDDMMEAIGDLGLS